jgi:hypothetical protein
MKLQRLAVLQWVGLLAGAIIWALQHIFGYGLTLAECNVASASWGISHDVWQASLMGAAAACVVVAEAAAIAVLFGTRETSYEAEPPLSRMRFFAIAAATANVLFLLIILLDGTANLTNVVCRQG